LTFGKRVENRSWSPSYPSRREIERMTGHWIALHASKGCARDYFDEAVESILDVVRPAPGPDRISMLQKLGVYMAVGLRGMHHPEGIWRPLPTMPFGAIVGVALVDGVIRNQGHFAAYAANVTDGDRQREWWMGGFAIVLADVKALDVPIPFKGAQGLFDVPNDIPRGSAVVERVEPRETRAPKIASREVRYQAVMKYHQRILETGSSERSRDEDSRPPVAPEPDLADLGPLED